MSITSGYTQTKTSFKWSSYQNVSKYSQAVFLFSDTSSYGMIIKYNSKVNNRISKYLLHVYDTNLHLKLKTNLTLHRFKESIMDIWYFHGKIFLLTQATLSNQRIALRLRLLETKSGQNEINYTDLVVLDKDHFSRNTAFNMSRKDSAMIIWHSNPLKSKNDNQVITTLTYDYGMNLIDKSIIDLPIQAELCKVYKIEPLIGGKFLIYTKHYFTRPLEKRGFWPNFNFVFYLVDPSHEALASVVLTNKNTYMDRFKLKVNNGVLEATGLYALKLDGPKLGLRVFRYDFNTSSTLLDSLHFFDKKVKDLQSNRFRSALFKNSKLESFYLDYYIKINEMDRLIVAEQFMILPASIGSSYTYNRFYGDILLLYLNTKGEVFEAKKIIKAQETYNNFGEFSSYYLERNDSTFSFFYNSSTSKDSNIQSKPLVWHKKSSLLVTNATPTTLKTKAVASYQAIEGIIQVKDMLKLNKHSYLVYAYYHKKGKLGIMTY